MTFALNVQVSHKGRVGTVVEEETDGTVIVLFTKRGGPKSVNQVFAHPTKKAKVTKTVQTKDSVEVTTERLQVGELVPA